MDSKIKILFLCGHKSPYGFAHLEPILESDFEVVAVVLATDKRWDIFRENLSGINYYPYKSRSNFLIEITKNMLEKISHYKVIRKISKKYDRSINIHEISEKFNVPIWYTDDVNSAELIQKVKDINFDLIVSAAYPQILSRTLISIPPKGAVNFHPSLLPKYRGAHPHYWVIVKGENESGLTAHFMTENIDDGDIISQIIFPIGDYDYKSSYEKIITETPNIVKKVEDFFYNGGVSTKQDYSKVSYFKNNREIHSRIFWELHTGEEICNLIRAGNAFCFFRNKKIIIEKSFVSETNRNLTNDIKVENGVIVDLGENHIAIKTKFGVINVQELIYENKKFTAPKFIIKYKPLIGEKF